MIYRLAIVICFLLSISKSVLSEERRSWWNKDYSYRLLLKGNPQVTEGKFEAKVNFTRALEGLGLKDRISLKSLRIVPFASKGNSFKAIIPFFLKGLEFNLQSNCHGIIFWDFADLSADGFEIYFKLLPPEKNESYIFAKETLRPNMLRNGSFQQKELVENIFSNCVGQKVIDVHDVIIISIHTIRYVIYINASPVNTKCR